MSKSSRTTAIAVHYTEHLGKDKKLGKLIAAPLTELPVRKNIALKLIASIMSQQLSTRVADVIYARFLALYDNREPTPQQIVDTPTAALRGIGLSNAKVTYVHNVAQFVITEKLTDARLRKMSDDEAITYLTQIKGVGRWTVEMLLIFYLGREDVFSAGDLNVQQAMIKLYKLDNTDKKRFHQQLHEISARWSPYRTRACRYLWAWKDGK